MEIWKSVPDFEGTYQVSSEGRIRSCERITRHGHRRKARPMRIKTLKSGYREIGLHKDGCVKQFLVHRLVLSAFVGPCPFGMQSCHGNADRSDNRLENLRWGTPAENTMDKVRHGTCIGPRGELSGTAKLKDGDVRRIFDLRASGCLQREIAGWFGVSRANVSVILSGKRWAHAEGMRF